MVLWQPEALAGAGQTGEVLRSFSYIVVEELVDMNIVLKAWKWPEADNKGRLFWRAGPEPKTAVVAQSLLHLQLYKPSRLRRLPRLGDVYAAARLGSGWEGPQPIGDVRSLFDGPVYDISADAREAAKLAYYGAVAPIPTTAMSPQEERLLKDARKIRQGLVAKQLKLSPPTGRRRA